jgi:hypothetical protein
MNFTPTEIILIIGLLVCFVFYLGLATRYGALKLIHLETTKHNRTLYDLYCQSHNSAVGILDSLNSALAYQKVLEERNHKLSLENLQYKFRDDPKLM